MVESIDIDLVTPFESLPALYPDAHRSDRARDLRRTVKAGIAIANLEILPELYPGMDINFARSGDRKIVEIKDNKYG